jgi:hypothetical protein
MISGGFALQVLNTLFQLYKSILYLKMSLMSRTIF